MFFEEVNTIKIEYGDFPWQFFTQKKNGVFGKRFGESYGKEINRLKLNNQKSEFWEFSSVTNFQRFLLLLFYENEIVTQNYDKASDDQTSLNR